MEDAGLLITNQPVILITHEPAIPSTSSRIPDSGANSQRVTLSHPNHWLQKIVALSLMCVLGFGMLVFYFLKKFSGSSLMQLLESLSFLFFVLVNALPRVHNHLRIFLLVSCKTTLALIQKKKILQTGKIYVLILKTPSAFFNETKILYSPQLHNYLDFFIQARVSIRLKSQRHQHLERNIIISPILTLLFIFLTFTFTYQNNIFQ